MPTARTRTADVISPVTNDGASAVALTVPYTARVTIEGVSPILFHRWSNEAVASKSAAAKNSAAKKTDDLETYVYRMPDRNLAIPGPYLRGALVEAARYRQDPRSPRKSAMDLVKAGVISLTELADLGTNEWAYVDRRRVLIQRSAVTRARPALYEGWRATFDFLITLPEYIDRAWLLDLLTQSGRLVGVGDFRPTYGRFGVAGFDVI
jgi:hypothetical protein